MPLLCVNYRPSLREGRFNHSFNQQTFTEQVLCVGTVLGTGDTAVNKTQSPAFKAYLPVEKKTYILKKIKQGEGRKELWGLLVFNVGSGGERNPPPTAESKKQESELTDV